MAVQAHDGADGCADDIDVLAIVVVGGYLGIACYSQSCCRMEVCECVLPKCGEGDASLDQSSTASRAWHMSLAWLWRFVEVHTPLVLLPDQGSDLLCQSIVQLPGSNVYRLSTTSGFNPKEAFARLKGMYPNLSTEEFGTRFHWRHRAMLSAMSALLHFCATCRINVADVIERSPPHLMYLTEEDARWLQVTRNDPHPCGYQGVGRSKEGLSLVSIIDRCQTSLGKKLLRQWLSLPSNDIEEIESRQEFIEWFVNPDRRELLHNLRKELHCVKPPRQVLTLLRCGKMSLRHYQSLFLCVNSLLTILELVTPCAHEVLFLRELVECLDVHSLVTMRDMMGSFVVQVTDKSSDRSAAAKKEHSCDGSSEVSIRPDVDSTGRLRDLHILLEHLGGSLAQKTEEAFNQLSCSLQRVLTLRCSHIVPHGYLLYVSTAPMDRLDLRNVEEQLAGHNEDDPLLTFLTDWGDGENCEEGALTNGTDSRVAISRRGSNVAFLSECYGWTFHHATGTHLFFKTPTMTELDSQVGDVMEHLHARERELRCCLDETLAQNACALTLASQTLAKLDSLLSLASCAVDFNWTRPSLRSDAGTLCIADGWHPILGTVVGPTAIQPFSIEMRRPQDRICIITGAHCSGKSVLLAAVAHIVILAHVGSFVPARRVEMGLIRSVLTIATMYGLEMGTSTSSFTADCSTLDRHVRYVDLLRTAVRPKNSAAADGEGGALAHVDGSRLFEGGEVDLLLLDEFGRGTSPEDGKALLGATLRYAAGMAPYDPQGEDSAAHSCIRRSTRPIVLCATHFVEMLDAQQDCDFRLDSGASFPFEEVQIYHMRCETAVAENPEEQDLVPTYTPYRVTQRDGHHELDYFQYRSALVDGGIFLGTTCGLERRMLENWKNAVAILKEGDAALKNINCGV